MKIFVAKLDYEITDGDLRKAFEAFGNVESANVVMDKYTGRSRGFGFVEMGSETDSRRAIEELNDTELQGRAIVVKKAEPRR